MSRAARRLLSGSIILVALSLPPQNAAVWERVLPAVVAVDSRIRRRPVRRFDGKWILYLERAE